MTIDIDRLTSEMEFDDLINYAFPEPMTAMSKEDLAAFAASVLEEAANIVEECEWPGWAEGVDMRDVFSQAIRAAKPSTP